MLRESLSRIAVLFGLLAAVSAGAPVTYTFTGTTQGNINQPAHSEVFTLTLPDLLPLVINGPIISFMANDPAVSLCSPCMSPPYPALEFNRTPSADQISFADGNIIWVYIFPLNALTTFGTFTTPPNWLSVGSVTISTASPATVPEPSTLFIVPVSLLVVAVGRKLVGRDAA